MDRKTGIFSGLSGQLQKKEADIGGMSLLLYFYLSLLCLNIHIRTILFNAGTVFFITVERLSILDYLSMEIPTYSAFIFRAPPLSYVSNVYYLPFSGIVWMCSFLLVILCTFVIALTMKFQFLSDETTESMGLSDYILLAVASTCQMGSEYLTKILSTRISTVCKVQFLMKNIFFK